MQRSAGMRAVARRVQGVVFTGATARNPRHYLLRDLYQCPQKAPTAQAVRSGRAGACRAGARRGLADEKRARAGSKASQVVKGGRSGVGVAGLA